MRLDVLSSGLAITKNCYRLLIERVVQLERNAFINAQYHWQEQLEVNPVHPYISNEVLELKFAKRFL